MDYIKKRINLGHDLILMISCRLDVKMCELQGAEFKSAK